MTPLIDKLQLEHPSVGSRALRDPLRHMSIERADQVWAANIAYLPMARGFINLAVVIDWDPRKVLSWRVSNILGTAACLTTTQEAIDHYGTPEIFTTDQGSQFTSQAFTNLLKVNGIRTSMDGKRSWRDNAFIERRWRTLKYEEVHLIGYESVCRARASLGRYLEFYNTGRPHSRLDRQTPEQVYFNQLPLPRTT